MEIAFNEINNEKQKLLDKLYSLLPSDYTFKSKKSKLNNFHLTVIDEIEKINISHSNFTNSYNNLIEKMENSV